MTDREARALYAKLAAAFPAARLAETTEAVYAQALRPLDTRRALEAVDDAIREHAFAGSIPPVASILDRYRRLRDKYAPPALPAPAVTPEERAENLRRLRLLTSEMHKPIDDRQWDSVTAQMLDQGMEIS